MQYAFSLYEFNLSLHTFSKVSQMSPHNHQRVPSCPFTVTTLNNATPGLPICLSLCQNFGSIRADVIEQMRFKQRLRVIQTIEDTTKRNVVRTHRLFLLFLMSVKV